MYNDKQKKSLRNLKIIEVILATMACLVAYLIIKHEHFNGDPVNYASWTWGFLVWIVIWLIQYRNLNYPEE